MKMLGVWWLGRLRRIFPMLFVLASLYILYKVVIGTQWKIESARKDATLLPTQLAPPASHQRVCWVIVESEDLCTELTTTYNNWWILLVGQSKPKHYSHSRCIYLNSSHIVRLQKKHSLQIPLSAVGYLYALENQAECMHVHGESDTLGSDILKRWVLGNTHTALVYNASLYFDLDNHCTCPGHNSNVQARQYSFCAHNTPVLQVPSRSTFHQGNSRAVHESCDASCPSVTLGQGTFTIVDLDGALFQKSAFWALPLLNFANIEERIIWGYIIQKLMWIMDSQILVYKNPLNIPAVDMGSQPELAHLAKYVCSSDDIIVCCTSVVRYGEKLWPSLSFWKNVDTFILWLKLLSGGGLGYTSSSSKNDIAVCNTEEVLLNYVYKQQHGRNEQFNTKLSRDLLDNTCRPQNKQVTTGKLAFNLPPEHFDLSKPWISFQNILLVVVFNKPHYEALPYVDLMYRSFFPKIIYCVPHLPDFNKHENLKPYKLSFVSYGGSPRGHVPGAFNYKCTSMVMDIGFDVDGFLMISDDLLLFIHKIQEFPIHQAWFLPPLQLRIGEITKLRECKLGMCDFYPHWDWWETYQLQTMNLLEYMKKERTKTYFIYKCYKELVRLNGAEYRANGGYSDIYYIPTRLAVEFSDLAKVFLRHSVFLEISVPTIMRCLESPEDTKSLRGLTNWMYDRDEPWAFFSKLTAHKYEYLHPTKWGYLSGKSNVTERFKVFYCNVLYYLHDRYGRIKQSQIT